MKPVEFRLRAAVAELVDAQASGACVRKNVEVRLLSAAFPEGPLCWPASGLERTGATTGEPGSFVRAAPTSTVLALLDRRAGTDRRQQPGWQQHFPGHRALPSRTARREAS